MAVRPAPRVMTSAPARTLAALVGAVFLLIGLLGFVPGVTTNLGDIRFAGRESGAELFGVFQVSVLHNLVHLLFGVAGLALARTVAGARFYLLVGGAINLVLWLYGMLVDRHSGANFIPLNRADDRLHLFLGLGMIALGLLSTRGPTSHGQVHSG
jgi:hypothetical protein